MTDSTSLSRRIIVPAVLAIALTIAVALVIALTQDLRASTDRYDRLLTVATQAHRGMYVPDHAVTTLAGDPAVLGTDGTGRRQLLFFLTTTCPFCRASLPAWKELTAEARAAGNVTVLGVVLDSAHLAEPYADEHALPFPLAVLEDQRYRRLFRVTRVPLTMVVDERGRVLIGRLGELTSRAAVDSVVNAMPDPMVGEAVSSDVDAVKTEDSSLRQVGGPLDP